MTLGRLWSGATEVSSERPSQAAVPACVAPTPVEELAPLALDVLVVPGTGCPAVAGPAAGAELCAAPDRVAAATTLHALLLRRASHLCGAMSICDLVRVGPTRRCILRRSPGHVDKDVLSRLVVIDSGHAKGAHSPELDDGPHNSIGGITKELSATGVWVRVCFAARIKHTATNQAEQSTVYRLAPLRKGPEISVHLESWRRGGCRHGFRSGWQGGIT